MSFAATDVSLSQLEVHVHIHSHRRYLFLTESFSTGRHLAIASVLYIINAVDVCLPLQFWGGRGVVAPLSKLPPRRVVVAKAVGFETVAVSEDSTIFL